MRKLRIILILALAALLDVGAGLPTETSEASEGFEEAAHGRRRLVRLASQPPPPSTGGAGVAVVAKNTPPGSDRPRPRSAASPVRKTPAPPPDPASATEDH